MVTTACCVIFARPFGNDAGWRFSFADCDDGQRAAL